MILFPAARSFFERELGPFKTRPNRAGWALNRCPFHRSQSGKSFSVNISTGAFHCFGCDAHGSDVVSFVRLRYKLSFREALKHLGIEETPTATPRRRKEWRPKSPARLLAEAVVSDPPENPERQQRLRLRAEIHLTAAIYRDVSARLSELLRGAPGAYPDEQEHCWACLSAALDDLRLTEAQYMRTCGLEQAS